MASDSEEMNYFSLLAIIFIVKKQFNNIKGEFIKIGNSTTHNPYTLT